MHPARLGLGGRTAGAREQCALPMGPRGVEALEFEGRPRDSVSCGREDAWVVGDADRGHGLLGARMEANYEFDDHPQRSQRADRELGQVVAGDVLDDPAAGARDAPVGQRELDSEQEVARRPVAVAQRPSVCAGEGAPDSRPGARVGRVEGEHLPNRDRPAREPASRATRDPGHAGLPARAHNGLVADRPLLGAHLSFTTVQESTPPSAAERSRI